MQSDLIGENVKTLVDITDLDEENNILVIDVCWYKDLLFIVGNNTKLYEYNTTSHGKNMINYANSISSVAVEWITEKIYWADPKKQIVSHYSYKFSYKQMKIENFTIITLLSLKI